MGHLDGSRVLVTGATGFIGSHLTRRLVADGADVHALTSAVSRVICLAGGRLIAEGEPQAVLDHPEVKEVYLGADYSAQARWQKES